MEGGKPFHSPPPPPPPQLHHAAKIIKQPIYQACIMYLAKTMRLSVRSTLEARFPFLIVLGFL